MDGARSAAFQRFIRSATESPTRREEYESFDLDALRALQGDERAAAKRWLLEQLADPDATDLRVVDALLELGDTDVTPALAEATARARERGQLHFLTTCARARHQLEPSYDLTDDLLVVLDYPGYFGGKVYALRLLAEVNPEAALDAGPRVLREELVPYQRSAIFDDLLRAAGAPDYDPGPGGPYRDVFKKLGSTRKAEVEAAVKKAEKVLASLRSSA